MVLFVIASHIIPDFTFASEAHRLLYFNLTKLLPVHLGYGLITDFAELQHIPLGLHCLRIFRTNDKLYGLDFTKITLGSTNWNICTSWHTMRGLYHVCLLQNLKMIT